MIKVEKEVSMLELAKQELAENALPLAVLREMPNGDLKRIEVY